MKKYELDLRIGKDGRKEYITQTQRKYFKLALDYVLNNKFGFISCKVNKIYYCFDFDVMQVMIRTENGYTKTYNIKEV